MKKGNGGILYHGSVNSFDNFNLDDLGSNGRALGFGVYLTDSSKRASIYSHSKGQEGFLYEVKCNLKDEFNLDELTISKRKLRKIVSTLNKSHDLLTMFGDPEFNGYENMINSVVNELYYNESDVDLVNEIATLTGDFIATAEVFEEYANKTHINSLVEGDLDVVVLNPKNINILNKKPLTRAD